MRLQKRAPPRFSRPPRGSSETVQNLDANLIEDSIGSDTLCADCIVRLTGMSSSRLNEALPTLIGALKVGSILAPCGVCLRQKIVHRRQY